MTDGAVAGAEAPRCFPPKWQGREELRKEACKSAQKASNLLIIYLAKWQPFGDWQETHGKPWDSIKPACRVVVLYEPRLNPHQHLTWRNALIDEENVAAARYVALPTEEPKDGWEKWLQSELDTLGWLPEDSKAEPSAVTITGEQRRLQFDANSGDNFDPGFLTIHPSSKMSVVLNRLDECKRVFRRNAPFRWNLLTKEREKIYKAVDELLALPITPDKKSGNKPDPSTRAMRVVQDTLKSANMTSNKIMPKSVPRVLLLGESGVGKTLVARYLAMVGIENNNVTSRPFGRVSLPQYLGKENMFEYDVFGYRAGAYTDAPKQGSRGFLINHIGGVVFFDEIGDASAGIQAKLLAYLDDYQVRPCGWAGEETIFCPTLVVAATNQPIEEWLDRSRTPGRQDEDRKEEADRSMGRFFRHDLFERFNFVVRVPSLDDRKEDDLPYILESMLYMNELNPGQAVNEIGVKAFEEFKKVRYAHSNFRLLETLLRLSCLGASTGGRNYITVDDVTKAHERAQGR
ncbi:MAG TPA: sigma 54-interacting transcriptional regulator [Candidatus Hydrogenedentes bacterium]|jgi:transcriptional regulator with AAA-type ATPase domain|nr:sigma 54-interacting transcriptional regulator [Candidatus Hydrogenedentota bacterium]